MKVDERHEFVKAYLNDVCLPSLYEKGQEYATEDGDSNGNFKRVARETDDTTLRVWNSFFQKHLDSIRNFVKDPNRQTAEPIEMRIADAINYLLILRTLIEEERQAKETTA